MVDVFAPAYQEDTKANWYQVEEENHYNKLQKLYTAEYAIR